MFYSGISDEAGDSIETQIRAHQQLGWVHLELRLVDGINVTQVLLNKALDPSTQPDAIQSFLKAETTLLRELVPRGSRVVDFGCGMGRHLIALSDHLSSGVGIDYEKTYIAAAMKASNASHLRFMVSDATAVPLTTVFDFAVCLTNTWGTMSDRPGVLAEMKRLSPKVGSRIITVYAPSSIPARSEWYANMGHEILEVTDDQIVASGGFSSRHFSKEQLQKLLGSCELHTIGDIAYTAQF